MDEKYMLNGIEISDTILELEFQPGEEVVLKRVNP
jgi:hypothetical protein